MNLYTHNLTLWVSYSFYSLLSHDPHLRPSVDGNCYSVHAIKAFRFSLGMLSLQSLLFHPVQGVFRMYRDNWIRQWTNRQVRWDVEDRLREFRMFECMRHTDIKGFLNHILRWLETGRLLNLIYLTSRFWWVTRIFAKSSHEIIGYRLPKETK